MLKFPMLPSWLTHLPDEFQELCTVSQCLENLSSKEATPEDRLIDKMHSLATEKYLGLIRSRFSQERVDPIDYTFFLLEIILPKLKPFWQGLRLKPDLDLKQKKFFVTTPYFSGVPYKEPIRVEFNFKKEPRFHYHWSIYENVSPFKKEGERYIQVSFRLVLELEGSYKFIPMERLLRLFGRDLEIFTHELIHLGFNLVHFKTAENLFLKYKEDLGKLAVSHMLFEVYDEALAYTFGHIVLLKVLSSAVDVSKLKVFWYLDNLRLLAFKLKRLSEDKEVYRRFQYARKVLEYDKEVASTLEKRAYMAVDSREVLASAWGGTALSFYYQFYKQAPQWTLFRDNRFDFNQAVRDLVNLIMKPYREPEWLMGLLEDVRRVYLVKEAGV